MPIDEKAFIIAELHEFDASDSSPAAAEGPPQGANALAKAPLAAFEALPDAQDAVGAARGALISPRSVETFDESLGRVAALLRCAPERIPWGTLEARVGDLSRALARRYKPATTAVTLAMVRSVFKRMWLLGAISRDRYERFKEASKTPRGSSLLAGRALEPHELIKVRDWAAGLPPRRGELVRGLFAAVLGAGLRAEEASGAPLASWRDGAMSLRIVGKGNKEREVAVGEGDASAIRAWLEVRRELRPRISWLFVRVAPNGAPVRPERLNEQWIHRLCAKVAKETGIDAFGPHDLRRTFATSLLEAGADLATVQRLMGHSSPKTTVGYDRRQASRDAEVRRGIKIWL